MVYLYLALCLTLGLAGIAAAGFALDQLGLFLERRGYIYWRTKPSGGGSSAFAPLQELTQPQIKHVVEVSDERWIEDADEKGDALPPRPPMDSQDR